jgi:hypothetical protein
VSATACARCAVEMQDLGGVLEVEVTTDAHARVVRRRRRTRERRCPVCLKRTVVVEESTELLAAGELEAVRREWRAAMRSPVRYSLHGNFVIYY